jgi:hypothetical protein
MSDNSVGIASNEDVALFQKLREAMAGVHQVVGAKVRSQHPKAHGVVQAAFQVHEVPEAYRIGVFANANCFPAWIRFSNGKQTDDRKPDVRGMAIKLLGVPGKKVAPDEANASTQDFVLASYPVFFAKDAKHFLQFLVLKGAQDAELKKGKDDGKSATELAELEKRQMIQLVTAFPVVREFFKTAASPLTLEYFSQTPYQFGTRVVKYFVKPVESNQSQNIVFESADLLRDAMQQRLGSERSAARFEFGIEVQTDPASMLIEDATQKWNSPEQVVLATITIPPQDFLSDTRTDFGEALSFSPWHSLPDHHPLGSINRTRRDTYLDSSVTRHKTTGAARQEPELSHFNSLTLTRFFACFSNGDYQGMQSCLHPDVEFTDIGFELRGKEVGAMWHMIVSKGIQVSFRDIKVDDRTGTAHWECDYQFRKDADSEPRPVHNVVEAKFCFDGGLIREHHDECDFWNWFEQAMGPIGKGAHVFDFLENMIERLLKRDLPSNIEQKVRSKVKGTAHEKITAFIKQNPKYMG